jgi:hypothetical protein
MDPTSDFLFGLTIGLGTVIAITLLYQRDKYYIKAKMNGAPIDFKDFFHNYSRIGPLFALKEHITPLIVDAHIEITKRGHQSNIKRLIELYQTHKPTNSSILSKIYIEDDKPQRSTQT